MARRRTTRRSPRATAATGRRHGRRLVLRPGRQRLRRPGWGGRQQRRRHLRWQRHLHGVQHHLRHERPGLPGWGVATNSGNVTAGPRRRPGVQHGPITAGNGGNGGDATGGGSLYGQGGNATGPRRGGRHATRCTSTGVTALVGDQHHHGHRPRPGLPGWGVRHQLRQRHRRQRLGGPASNNAPITAGNGGNGGSANAGGRPTPGSPTSTAGDRSRPGTCRSAARPGARRCRRRPTRPSRPRRAAVTTAGSTSSVTRPTRRPPARLSTRPARSRAFTPTRARATTRRSRPT